ncbi:hypothetical protein WJX84_008427 [Apatococcus fuscideae]|uniref:Uncharacterized protein n=1 Tax=Apatococcus fuscideae TaxID=2026836 RepID=A0AAW1SYI7_9CHLO
MAYLQRARACQQPAGTLRSEYSGDLRFCSTETSDPAASFSQVLRLALGLISAHEACILPLRGRRRYFATARARSEHARHALLLPALLQVTLSWSTRQAATGKQASYCFLRGAFDPKANRVLYFLSAGADISKIPCDGISPRFLAAARSLAFARATSWRIRHDGASLGASLRPSPGMQGLSDQDQGGQDAVGAVHIQEWLWPMGASHRATRQGAAHAQRAACRLRCAYDRSEQRPASCMPASYIYCGVETHASRTLMTVLRDHR